MSYHASALQVSRHTKRTLYVITGLYVTVGFALSAASALHGDRLGTFLGFLIISASLVAATVVRSVLRMEVCVAAIAEGVDELRSRLIRVEDLAGNLAEHQFGQGHLALGVGHARMLDLAAIGRGDPSRITAAILDGRAFPRLVATMDEEPPAQSGGAGLDDPMAELAPDVDGGEDVLEHGGIGDPGPKSDDAEADREPSGHRLLLRWRRAMDRRDLVEGRFVLAALIGVNGSDHVAPLRAELEALADRVEGELREAFGSRVRARDFQAALAVGERLRCLLPDRPVAQQFERIRPLLIERMASTALGSSLASGAT